jgi:ABC-2 type transport system ATP-binding protein
VELMLTVQNLSFDFGGYPVLDDLSFTLEAGRIYPLVGSNGSGKSTLLQCLAGWRRAPSADITVRGVSVRDERAYRRHIHLVPDVPDFFDELTLWEHIALVTRLYEVRDWHDSARSYLERLQLLDLGDRYPFTFSRGMKVKLALILAFLVTQDLLLLDEPFGPLDPPTVLELLEILNELGQKGKTVLFSTHNLNTVQPYAEYLLLYEGHIHLKPIDDLSVLQSLISRDL